MSGRPENGGPGLADLGEDEVVRRLTEGLPVDEGVVAGAGRDDCAVLRSADPARWQLYKTDCLVGGVHYAWDTPGHLVGRKAMNRCLSDIAAMGGVPTYALATVAIDRGASWERLRSLYEGLRAAADPHRVCLVGGETSRTPGAATAEFLSVALLGWVEAGKAVLRSGGSAGDFLYVTGRLGGSLRGRHLTFEPRLREARWLAEEIGPAAMMDLSDGLGRDLPRLAAASGAEFAVDLRSLPCAEGCGVEEALRDGEDYELLFAVAPERADELDRGWARAFPALPLTRIGRLAGPGEGVALPASGWDHFAAE